MTFRIIHRGAPRPIASEFLCPMHGRFEAVVDSGADCAPCPADVHVPLGDDIFAVTSCKAPSPWSPSKAPPMRMKRVEAVRGNHEKPQHKGWLDTSNLEEGQDFGDWQADREAVHEELRKDLVMEMVRSDR